MTENTRSVYVTKSLRGKWVPERLCDQIADQLQSHGNDRVIHGDHGEAQTARNLREQLLAIPLILTLTAKPIVPEKGTCAKTLKREEGKWYAGKIKKHDVPLRPWLFLESCFRIGHCGFGYGEHEFDWISDTPLDLRKE